MRRQRHRRQRARRHVPQMQQPRGRAPGTIWTAVISGHGQHGRRGGAGAVRPDDAGGRAPAERRHVPRRALGVRARLAR